MWQWVNRQQADTSAMVTLIDSESILSAWSRHGRTGILISTSEHTNSQMCIYFCPCVVLIMYTCDLGRCLTNLTTFQNQTLQLQRTHRLRLSLDLSNAIYKKVKVETKWLTLHHRRIPRLWSVMWVCDHKSIVHGDLAYPVATRTLDER